MQSAFWFCGKGASAPYFIKRLIRTDATKLNDKFSNPIVSCILRISRLSNISVSDQTEKRLFKNKFKFLKMALPSNTKGTDGNLFSKC